mgnify:FL=1|tara:strand:+ start:98 stop:508 length:411 start_codon:yes stop_codon:yes gene_type:complete
MQDIETKTENYTVTWTWNLAYDDQMNMHQVVIPNCKHQKDAEQKAFEYMLDTWVSNYDTMQEMIDECFSSFMVTCMPDDEYMQNHAYKYWRGRWDNPIEGIVDPMLDELEHCGYFDNLKDGHYLGYKNVLTLEEDD